MLPVSSENRATACMRVRVSVCESVHVLILQILWLLLVHLFDRCYEHYDALIDVVGIYCTYVIDVMRII